ncbi:MAG TPA: gfo/Idh/MocA family oxidoreductase [Clostridiales bacterium]|nr:gfo/Idh/MocA family oxidoreductase [Clostridiales bacterium]
MSNKPLKIAIVGAGHRGLCYSRYAVKHPDKVRIWAVADPNDYRRNQTAKEFNIPAENVFKDAQSMAQSNIELDAVINGTMDQYHIQTTLPLLERGWDVLLEKPVCTNEEDLHTLYEAANKNQCKVMVCHVLRYAPFYVAVKKLLLSGEIGEILTINSEENVSYHHMSTAYIRGRWRNKDICGSPILMAKCCHDLDLITWFMSGVAPSKVASFGSLMYFKPENAPKGSGKKCLVDCKIERECPYSAYNQYIEKNLWGAYAWESVEHHGDALTREMKIESLKKDNPFGRCVWHCDNNVADHQTVIMGFKNSVTATHTLTGNAAKPCRTLHIIGTKGEIEGNMNDGTLILRKPDLNVEYTEKEIELNVKGDGHGGGDARLTEDFINYMIGEEHSISTTSLEDSLYGHLIGFEADRSMNNGVIAVIPEL